MFLLCSKLRFGRGRPQCIEIQGKSEAGPRSALTLHLQISCQDREAGGTARPQRAVSARKAGNPPNWGVRLPHRAALFVPRLLDGEAEDLVSRRTRFRAVSATLTAVAEAGQQADAFAAVDRPSSSAASKRRSDAASTWSSAVPERISVPNTICDTGTICFRPDIAIAFALARCRNGTSGPPRESLWECAGIIARLRQEVERSTRNGMVPPAWLKISLMSGCARRAAEHRPRDGASRIGAELDRGVGNAGRRLRAAIRRGRMDMPPPPCRGSQSASTGSEGGIARIFAIAGEKGPTPSAFSVSSPYASSARAPSYRATGNA